MSRHYLHPLTPSAKCNRMIPHFLPFSQCFSHLPATQQKGRIIFLFFHLTSCAYCIYCSCTVCEVITVWTSY
ncbi:hypothetical protein OBV_36810 [Oscillibacter valericigenes Sjm18-20]|nr:hypothetical protein OBV_36810 [Oscillibacter valericigenes Sjm18-20]